MRGRPISNFKKHGYTVGLENMPPQTAILHFCRRRSGDVVKEFETDLPMCDLIARVYYQGLMDGRDIYRNQPSRRVLNISTGGGSAPAQGSDGQ